MERELVTRSGLELAGYHELYAGPIHGVGIRRALASVLKLGLGSLQALALVIRTRPGVVLLTGGWANLPLALAAWSLRAPIVIYLPDIEPGLTIRVLQPMAKRIAITAAPSAGYFPTGKTVVTGYPLARNRLCATRAEARRHFKLESDRKTLLVFGGSRGARSINLALAHELARLLELGLQIIHVTGEFDWDAHEKRAGDLMAHPRYHAFAYLHDEMALAFAAADLALCRAGASALAELPWFGLPSILAPYPHAWRYQRVNADYLVRHGAAIRLNDEDLEAKLHPTVSELLKDENRLKQMRENARAMASGDGAQRLAELLIEVGGG